VLKNKVDIISLEVSSAKVLLSYHHLLPLQSHTINWCYLALEWVKKKLTVKRAYVPPTRMETLMPVNSKILRLYPNSIYLKPVSNTEGWVHLRWNNDKVKDNTVEEVWVPSRKRYSRATPGLNTLLHGLRAEEVSEHNSDDG